MFNQSYTYNPWPSSEASPSYGPPPTFPSPAPSPGQLLLQMQASRSAPTWVRDISFGPFTVMIRSSAETGKITCPFCLYSVTFIATAKQEMEEHLNRYHKELELESEEILQVRLKARGIYHVASIRANHVVPAMQEVSTEPPIPSQRINMPQHTSPAVPIFPIFSQHQMIGNGGLGLNQDNAQLGVMSASSDVGTVPTGPALAQTVYSTEPTPEHFPPMLFGPFRLMLRR
ncbi:hypothetical protein BJ508DRAFT_333609 [Ascobolus immersus RN42]|uniref:Uncharacterized protein n=1 Tax=Ascobolus immersus RN42 TaxID=1160509 RepID=A0A3N4HIZ8_ASCIM|nr:hypothetical protein BJ508DRAFT_333609 [Ascobolus immersus RN42]